jgi:hypothetical protein
MSAFPENRLGGLARPLKKAVRYWVWLRFFRGILAHSRYFNVNRAGSFEICLMQRAFVLLAVS